MAAKKGTFRLSIGVDHKTWGIDEAEDAAKLLDREFMGCDGAVQVRHPDLGGKPIPGASVIVTCTRRDLDAAVESLVEAIKPLVNETLSELEDSKREDLIVVVIQEELGYRCFTPHAYRSRTAKATPPGAK